MNAAVKTDLAREYKRARTLLRDAQNLPRKERDRRLRLLEKRYKEKLECAEAGELVRL